MAPEQARGEAVDHRADIWSFGLVLYEMVKGTRPAPAVRLRVEESSELERIISKCLETDRDLRYQHAADLRTDLERLTSGADPVQTTSRQLFGRHEHVGRSPALSRPRSRSPPATRSSTGRRS